MAQTIKNLPAIQGTWVQSLGHEVCPEKEMTTHSSILAWEIPWTEEPGGVDSPCDRRKSLAMYRRNKYTWNEWEKEILKISNCQQILFIYYTFPNISNTYNHMSHFMKKSWWCYKHVKSSSEFNISLSIYRKKLMKCLLSHKLSF